MKKHPYHPHYGARTPIGFWIESVFIAVLALTFIAVLLAMMIYA